MEESEIDLSPTDVTLNLTVLLGRSVILSLAFTNTFESVKRAPLPSFSRFSVESVSSSSSPGFNGFIIGFDNVDEKFRIEFSVNERLISSPFLMNVLPSS